MVAGSERRSNLEERAAWSAPRVTTSGQMTLREKDMEKEWTATGLSRHGARARKEPAEDGVAAGRGLESVGYVKPRMRGYISMGESVPEVITTDWNLSKTGFIAIDASLQQNWKRGS